MPRKTVSPPSTADTFLWRVCKALDEPPRVLAANIGVPYAELEPFLSDRHLLAGLDEHEVWWLVAQHVDQRLGELMAAKAELNKALARDRKRRVLRHAAQAAANRKRKRPNGLAT